MIILCCLQYSSCFQYAQTHVPGKVHPLKSPEEKRAFSPFAATRKGEIHRRMSDLNLSLSLIANWFNVAQLWIGMVQHCETLWIAR